MLYNGNEFNGKSILDLTSLAAECGTRLEVEARGPDAAEAVAALADLVSAQFHEDENGESKDVPRPRSRLHDCPDSRFQSINEPHDAGRAPGSVLDPRLGSRPYRVPGAEARAWHPP